MSAELTKRATIFQACDCGGRLSSQALRIIGSLYTSTPSFPAEWTSCEKLFKLISHNMLRLWCAIHRETPYLEVPGWWNTFHCCSAVITLGQKTI